MLVGIALGAFPAVADAEPSSGSPIAAPPGQFRFRVFGAGEGLKNLVVWSLAQDAAGQIWVGTDDGAYRYDGKRFTLYGVDDGLLSSAVTVLGVGIDGEVCAGGSEGLACWDQTAGRFRSMEPLGIPRVPIRAIDHRHDQVWVGTDQGLYVRNRDRYFHLAPGWPTDNRTAVPSVWADARGVVAAYGTHVLLGDGDGAWRPGGDPRIGPEPIDGIVRDSRGQVWVRTAVKMWLWSPDSGALVDMSEGLPPNLDGAGRPAAMALGPDDEIWVGTDRGPAFRRDGRWQIATRERGLPASLVRAMLIDHEGSTWVGTRGVMQWTGRSFTERYDEASGFPGDIAWTIGRDSKGELAFGTDRCLVRPAADGRGWICHPGTTERIVRSFVSMPDGGMFIGGAPGDLLYLAPDGQTTSLRPEPYRPEDHILALELAEGDLWVGTRTSLFRLPGARAPSMREGGAPARPGLFERITIPGVGTTTRISHLLRADDRLWVTTSAGLAVRERGTWRVFGKADGLRSVGTRYLVRRANGRMCVSYTEAIGFSCFRYDGERITGFEHVGVQQGLAAGMVYFLVEDRAGRLWVGTGNGIDIVASSGLGPMAIDHFGEEDGLAGNDGAAKGAYLDTDGSLWMGASGGMSRISAQHYRGPPPPPQARVLDGRLAGRTIALGGDAPLIASHDANALLVSYATGTFLDPGRTTFQTRLLPVESEWSTNPSAEVRTPALPAGTYRLGARARIGAGPWGPTTEIGFEVRPAWWQTTWVVGSLVGAVLCALGLLIAWRYRARVRRRTRQLIEEAHLLEARVAARTAELDDRNRGMRMVLDNVAQGFVTLDLDGVMASERSAIVDTWFGSPPPGTKLADLVAARTDESEPFPVWLSFGLDSLRDGIEPYELIALRLPSRFAIGEQTFDVAYSPIRAGEEVQRVLLIISDVTAQVAAERAERVERDLFAIFKRLSSDRSGFEEFVHDTNEQVASLEIADDAVVEKRIVHTLKGNCALFGLEGYSELCHRVEDELAAQDGAPLSAAQRELVVNGWRQLVAKVMAMLGGERRLVVEVERSELAAVIDYAERGGSGRELAMRMLAWSREPVSRRFERLARHASQLAVQLGKATPEIAIRDGGVRLDPVRWAPFWAALVHVVRNAVDHGIEPSAERARLGKPEQGTLTLTASEGGGRVRIAIGDDGGGIDWEALQRKAERAGVPSATREDLEDALFLDGISTREQVTMTSGRGVGLAMLREEVRVRGGTIHIDSTPGAGTTITFELPGDTLAITAFAADAPRHTTRLLRSDVAAKSQ